MKKIIAMLAVTFFCTVNAMLPRMVAKNITRTSQVSKIRTISRNFSNDENHFEPVIHNAVGQVIMGIPAGWLGAAIGGFFGAGAGNVIGIAPTFLLRNKEAHENSVITVAVIGGISVGTISAYAFTGMRGVLSCGTTSALLYAVGHWNSLDGRQKEKIRSKFRHS